MACSDILRFTTLALVAVLFLSRAHGASNANPVSVFSCDATATHWGCDPSDWVVRNNRVDRLLCQTVPRPIMYWADKVKRTDKYSVFAGPEKRKLQRYTPDSIIDITVLVNDYTAKYRGILIYAEDAAKNRVGEWKLRTEFPALFQLPWPDTHVCRQSLMHLNAVLKPLKVTFKWQAPPAGTGAVFFRALIKQGDANTGAFYTPNIDGDLRLGESTDPKPEQTWFESKVGQSCTDRCAEENLLCDVVSIERVNSPNRIDEEITPAGFLCKKPYLSACGAIGASISDNGFCYYDDTRCTSNRIGPPAPVDCDATSNHQADGRRFCKCLKTTLAPQPPESSQLPVTTPPSGGTQSRGANSPATRPSASLLAGLLIAVGSALKHKSSTPLLLIVLIALAALPQGAHGHNWFWSRSRSRHASTISPCPAKNQVMPHVQVGLNQLFQLEWATGHQDWSYFIVVHEKDADKLKFHDKASIAKYFNEAPSLQQIPIYHRQFKNRGSSFESHKSYYEPVIPKTSPDFIPRPDAFGLWADDASFFKYKSQYHQDNYAEYFNPDMPWVESMLRVEHLVHRPNDGDMAMIKIPGRAGTGQYIVHWLWRGYRDCVDVDYVTDQVEHVYGTNPDPGAFSRIDHCYFPDFKYSIECSRVYDDLSICERKCPASANWCHGIAVMPLSVGENRWAEQAGLLPKECTDNFDFNSLAEDPKDVYVCFGVNARNPSDTFGRTERAYEGDPAYHATCYLRENSRQFPGFDPPKRPEKIPWRHGERCIDCNAAELNSNDTRVPKWPLSEDCINCDREPITRGPYNPPKLVNKDAGKTCDGTNGWWSNRGGGKRHHSCPGDTHKQCHKKLIVNGRKAPFHTQFFMSECARAAANDPDCSDDISARNGWASNGDKKTIECHCHTKLACCNGCLPITRNTWNKYDLDRGTD